MRPASIATGAALALLLCLAPALAAAQDLSSSNRLHGLSEVQAGRQIRQDLSAILRPEGDFPKGVRIHATEGVIFTRPYGTPYKGLCSADLVTVKYAPVDGAPGTPAALMEPYGIETEHLYHFTRPPVAREAAYDDDIWDEDCARIKPVYGEGWFSAETPLDAVRAANALRAAVDLVRSGKATNLSCDLGGGDSDCATEMDRYARVEQIESVRTCDETPTPDRFCYDIEVGGLLRMTVRGVAEEEDVAPTSVDSIRFVQEIVIT